MKKILVFTLIAALRGLLPSQSEAVEKPIPTFQDVAYGSNPRQLFDLWQAPSGNSVPLVIFIHGGGFISGTKANASAQAIGYCLASGVSFMSVEYRFLKDAPIQDILRDGGRAVQFVRYHAKEYHIDPERIACYGSSGGAGMSLWLATHSDLADPANADPVLRESTHISAVGCLNGQATYDLTKWKDLIGAWRPEWLVKPTEISDFYHFKSDADFDKPEGKRVLADCDMAGMVSGSSAPAFLFSDRPDGDPDSRGSFEHSPRHMQAVKKRYDDAGAEAELFTPAEAVAQNKSPSVELARFLFKHLGVH